jgi:pyruvate/2-oxoglutarate/acetoin dehydrogenase E1 component
MMPKIVLPHWLNATKLWKHSKTTSFLLKCAPSPAFFNQYQAAPIRRVTAPHTPVPFAPDLEKLYIPSPEKIAAAVREVHGYGK